MTALLRETVGDVLRRSRRSQGRTLREVAACARVSLGYLSEVERGRKEASSELLNSICGALDLPLSAVLIDAGHRMAQEEGRDGRGGARFAAPHIDTGTKVVIPPLTAMATA